MSTDTGEYTGFVYLCQPYTSFEQDKEDRDAEMDNRADEGARYAAYLINTGRAVFAPIPHGHYIAKRHSLPRGIDFWWGIDREFVRAATELHVLCLPGWAKSEGVAREIRLAYECNIPIKYIDPQGDHAVWRNAWVQMELTVHNGTRVLGTVCEPPEEEEQSCANCGRMGGVACGLREATGDDDTCAWEPKDDEDDE